MSDKLSISQISNKANNYFKSCSIDDNIIGLQDAEYSELYNCCFCGRRLQSRRALIRDSVDGISVAGKRCPCCGTIYATVRIIYVMITACNPDNLTLNYRRPAVTYERFKPIKGWQEFIDREDIILVPGKHIDLFDKGLKGEKEPKELNRHDNSISNESVSKRVANQERYKKQGNSEVDNYPIIQMDSIVVIDDSKAYKATEHIIMIMSKVTGKVFYMKIQAEYRSDCSHFFISKETYNRLFENGIPLCRLIKRKDYNDRLEIGNLDLKPQSILMDYGYNVSEQNGLSVLARRNILSMLIDKKICSRSRIVSYLEFFIKQRQSNGSMNEAISKWEDDIRFLSNYRAGKLEKTWTDNLEIRD